MFNMIFLLLSRPRYMSAHCYLNRRFLSEFCFMEICFILLYLIPILSFIVDATKLGFAFTFSYCITSLTTYAADLMRILSSFIAVTTFSMASYWCSLSSLFAYSSYKKFLFFLALFTNTETTVGFTLYCLATYA